MRVILNTNILISNLISPSGKPAKLIDAWLDGRLARVGHASRLGEFRAVSRRERTRPLLRASEAGRLVNRIACTAWLGLDGRMRFNEARAQWPGKTAKHAQLPPAGRCFNEARAEQPGKTVAAVKAQAVGR